MDVFMLVGHEIRRAFYAEFLQVANSLSRHSTRGCEVGRRMDR
jgi:hypothetical protein